MAKHKLVQVIWRDIIGAAKWMEEEEAVQWAEEQFAFDYKTVGYIIHSNSRYIVLAGTLGDEHYHDISMIPKTNIKKIKRIK